jgi:uncharacterized protein (DUF305 family)
MSTNSNITKKHAFSLSALASIVLLSVGQVHAQDVPIVKPGAPGNASTTISAAEAIDIANTSYTDADVSFMQNMIPHHAQAVEMGLLVEDRTNNEEVIDIAGRIKKSQDDEIEFMRNWLIERDLPTQSPHHMHMDHSMMGMATPEQMIDLANAEGKAFDELFLKLMIPHHEGAVTMVNDLLDQPGSAYDPILFDFVSDIVNDQSAEITQMNKMLENLSSDPRVGLSAGFRDAQSAISNLNLLASYPKPNGFFDPNNPANLPPVKSDEQSDDQSNNDATEQAEDANNEASNAEGGDIKTEYGERWPLLSFWNTDMAFSKDILVAGNYHGFNIYKLDDAGMPQLASSIVCPGGQGDVSIVGDLLIMSVEQTRGRIDCGLEGVDEDVSNERFRGLRIFDIKDITRPIQVGIVQTCRGSHTHSVVSADERKIVVYNSGTAGVRDNEELAGCIGDVPGDERTALFRIDVIEIPVKNPQDAKIVSSPAVFADDEGRVAGLWLGGDHGENTQKTRRTDQCHDITVYPELKLAAGACSGNGILFDISNPSKPKRLDAVTDPGFAYWHSATFNNDGTAVLFTDEWGGGTQPRCRASDPKTWGANAIYSINDGKLSFESYYKIDAPQSESENCVAHNGSIVPVPGRDIFVQAWYQGGMSLMDFTDPSKPIEIAYFDRGPIYEDRLVIGGYWSTYWFNGKIYGTGIIRGLDVFELTPSEHLSEAEIAAAKMANMGDIFNPQQQFEVTWPADPQIAMVYLEQLSTSEVIDAKSLASIEAMLSKASTLINDDKTNRKTSRALAKLTKSIKVNTQNRVDKRRVSELKETLERIAKRIR